MSLPNFLCIGATKAGTSWLNEQLNHHPEVLMPIVKELQYFSSLFTPGHRKWATKTVTRALNRALRHSRQAQSKGGAKRSPVGRHLKQLISLEIFSQEWYERCFERPDRAGTVIGEITPSYAELPEEGIRHVTELLPGVRVIHILRHPLDRALSHIRMAAHRHEIEPGEDALMSMILANEQIFSRGDYQDQLPRWLRAVSRERMMIIPFGRVREEPQELLRDVEAFIGVSPFGNYPAPRKVNTTRPIDIPSGVLSYIEQRVQPSVEFIRSEFGDDFLTASR